MADVTAAGTPLPNRKSEINIRRLKLQIRKHEASIEETEIEIAEKYEEIRKKQERAESTRVAIQQIEAELAELGEKNG